MRRSFILVVSMAAWLSASVCTRADEPKKESSLQDRLVGTWRLVSAKYGGQDTPFPEGWTTLKHVTPAQFMWVSYGPDGAATRAAGGAYTLQGDRYEETPEYGVGDDFNAVKSQTHSFTCRIEGDKWHHTGELKSGLTIEEVWERVGGNK
jgi:hypothetical protein